MVLPPGGLAWGGSKADMAKEGLEPAWLRAFGQPKVLLER